MKTSKTSAAKGNTKKTKAKTEASKSPKTSKSATAGSARKNITEEMIRQKAQEIYNQRVARGEHGTPEGDWIKAENTLKGLK
jgi:hypothetical protein